MRGTALAALALAGLAGALLAPASAAPHAASADHAGLGLDGGDGRGVEGGACRAAAPCGFVTPILDLEFPDKPACGASSPIMTEEARKDCLPMLALGESLELTGTVSWSWQFSDEGTYPNDPEQDIVIRFPRNDLDQDWIDVTVEPAQYAISTATLLDPQYFVVDDSDPTRPVVWYRYEQPVTATLTRTGDPSPEEEQSILDREPRGILRVYVRAVSNASGTYFTSAFGLDPVRFDYQSNPDGAAPPVGGDDAGKDSPAATPGLLALLVLAVAALALRRAGSR